MRIVWFINGLIEVIYLGFEINAIDFQFECTTLNSVDLYKKIRGKADSGLWMYAGDEEFPKVNFNYKQYSDVYFWIEKLTKVNIQYSRTYALEYLIDPPDVQRICNFSIRLKSELWESVLKLGENIITGKLKEDQLGLFEFCINFLAMTKIEPEIDKISMFFKNQIDNLKNIDVDRLKRIIDLFQGANDKSKGYDFAAKLDEIPPGPGSASEYHNHIFSVLKYLFMPSLKSGKKEQEVNEGRKRIDIVFDNTLSNSFFNNLHMLHSIKCPYIMIECKNYSDDIGNPELDQLAGRLNSRRGEFGILVCRKIKDKDNLLRRCRDIVNDNKHYIIVLDDADIKMLLDLKDLKDEVRLNDYLGEKLKEILL